MPVGMCVYLSSEVHKSRVPESRLQTRASEKRRPKKQIKSGTRITVMMQSTSSPPAVLSLFRTEDRWVHDACSLCLTRVQRNDDYNEASSVEGGGEAERKNTRKN